MKHKPLICLAIISLLLLSAFSLANHFISATSAPVLSVVLSGTTSTTNIPAQAVGTTFEVDVRVDNIASVNPGVNGISYNLTWDPLVLECINQADNNWLPGQEPLGDIPADNTQGLVIIGQVAFDATNRNACATTPGVSATFTFQVLSSGICTIGLGISRPGVPYLTYPPGTGNNNYSPVIGTTVVNATYGISPSLLPHGPTASFTPVDGSTFLIGTTVTLNASSSQPGYDTQTYNITNYAWSVEYLNDTTFASLSGETATFTASAEGTFRIILIVYANDTQASPSPSYTNTNSATALITVVPSMQVVSIEVSTSGGGSGSGASSVIYGPLQLVQMYASVTYSGISMPDQNVLFSIQNSNDSIVSTRDSLTNQTGIASANFTIPPIDPTSPQYSFGAWSIIASVDILNTTVTNTTNFTFSYQSGIQNVTLPASIHRTQTLPIELTINNQYLSAQWTQLSITVFDYAGEPIGSTIMMTSQQTQNITVVDATITIPSWVFTGQATAYFCLLTNSTNGLYTSIAPETTATFNILS
jgi:hypothetical protein